MAGAVDYLLVSPVDGAFGSSIHCNVPDAAGSITVPSALLAKLPKGDMLVIVLDRIVTTTATGANVTVTMSADAELGGMATLQ